MRVVEGLETGSLLPCLREVNTYGGRAVFLPVFAVFVTAVRELVWNSHKLGDEDTSTLCDR